MHILSKQEALGFVAQHAAVLDASSNPPNPFACSEWILHFIDQIADEDWRILVAQGGTSGDGLMLSYHHATTPWRCSALANYYASLYLSLIHI